MWPGSASYRLDVPLVEPIALLLTVQPKLSVMFGRWRSRRLPILVVLLSAGAALLWPAEPASAHAVVIDTHPGPGAVLAEAPTEVSITFNETVSAEADSIIVIDADGGVVSGAASASGSTMAASIDPDTVGWHAVSWWAVSADGHPVSGAWTFRIGEGTEAAPDGLEDQAVAAATPSTASRWTFTISQWASTLAAVVATGTAFCFVIFGQMLGHRRTLWPVALATTASGATLSLLAAAANGPYTAVSISWFDGPASNHYLGRAGLLALSALLLIPLRDRLDHRIADRAGSDQRPGAVAGIVFLALTGTALCLPVLVGHTSTSGPLATIGVITHLLVGGAWLGSIPALLLLLKAGAPARVTLSTFSRAATWLLALTLVAGGLSALVLGGWPGAMARRWGLTLVVKIALVGVAIAAGSWNRWKVVPQPQDSPQPSGREQTSLALKVEAVALVLVVAASIALTHNGPPRAADAVAAGPAVIDEMVEDIRLQLIIDPAQVGENEIHLFVLNEAGIPLNVEDAIITFAAEKLNVGRVQQEITNLGAGHFMGITNDLGLAGKWEAEVVVRPDRFSQVELTAPFEVRR